jgi:hypothetical protein
MTWTTITNSDDVTEEIIEMAHLIVDGWYSNCNIVWDDFLDRLESYQLSDGSYPNLGTNESSAAIRKIKREARKYKALDQ